MVKTDGLCARGPEFEPQRPQECFSGFLESTLSDGGEGGVGRDCDRVQGDGKLGHRVHQDQRCTQRGKQPLPHQ